MVWGQGDNSRISWKWGREAYGLAECSDSSWHFVWSPVIVRGALACLRVLSCQVNKLVRLWFFFLCIFPQQTSLAVLSQKVKCWSLLGSFSSASNGDKRAWNQKLCTETPRLFNIGRMAVLFRWVYPDLARLSGEVLTDLYFSLILTFEIAM